MEFTNIDDGEYNDCHCKFTRNNFDVVSNGITTEKKFKKRKNQLSICLTNCKYEAVQLAAFRFGFREVSESEEWNLYWSDSCIPLAKLMDMKKFQKVNHFPGMLEICRKDLLARNLNRAFKLFPKDYNFFPKTFYLPADFSEFRSYTRHRRKSVFILKPENNCQGKGIRLAKNNKVQTNGEHFLCQHYISKPYLINNLKFDLRIYVLVTSCDPLRIYTYNEGLARFATVNYEAPNKNNIDNVFMHLTNYSIQKKSKDFNKDEDVGSKRKFSTIMNILRNEGKDVDRLQKEMDDLIVKTIISICSVLRRNHLSLFLKHSINSACFEILGFDILLDNNLKPFLLEVNHSPSFAMETDLDREIKETLIFDTLRIIDFNKVDKRKCLVEQRRNLTERLILGQRTNQPLKKRFKADLDKERLEVNKDQEDFELKHIGNFRILYPVRCPHKMEYYGKFFNSLPMIFQETKSSRMKAESARIFRENLLSKCPKTRLREESPKDYPREEIQAPINTLLPMDIKDADELKRLRELSRRHTQMRMYGVMSSIESFFTLMQQTKPTLFTMHQHQCLSAYRKDSSLMSHIPENFPENVNIAEDIKNQNCVSKIVDENIDLLFKELSDSKPNIEYYDEDFFKLDNCMPDNVIGKDNYDDDDDYYLDDLTFKN